MRHPMLVPLLLAASAVLPGCDFDPGVQSRQTEVATRKLDPRGTFRLDNPNGGVTIETWSRPSVRIEAEKVGYGRQLERIQVEIRGEGDRVSVETRQPLGTIFGGGGHVNYRVTVPEEARLEIAVTNGRVHVQGPRGAVRASCTNGSVEIEGAQAAVEASATNGRVLARFRQVPDAGTTRLSTTNGAVTLRLPAGASGRFEARTVNGSIRSDFPLESQGSWPMRRLEGRLGDSRARFELHTVNGPVRIQKDEGAARS